MVSQMHEIAEKVKAQHVSQMKKKNLVWASFLFAALFLFIYTLYFMRIRQKSSAAEVLYLPQNTFSYVVNERSGNKFNAYTAKGYIFKAVNSQNSQQTVNEFLQSATDTQSAQAESFAASQNQILDNSRTRAIFSLSPAGHQFLRIRNQIRL